MFKNVLQQNRFGTMVHIPMEMVLLLLKKKVNVPYWLILVVIIVEIGAVNKVYRALPAKIMLGKLATWILDI